MAHLVKIIKDGVGVGVRTGGKISMVLKGVSIAGSTNKRKGNFFYEYSVHRPIFFLAIGMAEAHEGPIIVSAVIAGQQVRRIYVDGGSASNTISVFNN